MKIAITGGIAEGKSTVLKMLESFGFSVASADAIAKDVFWIPDVQKALAKLLATEGDVSHVTLREAIALQPGLRREVNQIMHPFIVAALEEDQSQFIEVPLLLEACLHPDFDAVWVVTCGEAEQRRRLEERYPNGVSIGLLDSQLNCQARLAFADSVIFTNVSKEETEQTLRNESKRYGLPLVY
jgi:dephospho-CoA kinase